MATNQTEVESPAVVRFLLAVVVAVWYMCNTEVDSRLNGGGLFNAVLIIGLAIALLVVYTIE